MSACSIGAAMAVLSAPLAARPHDGSLDLLRGEPGQLLVEPRIALDPVRHSELAGGLTTTARSRRPAVTVGGRGLLVEPTGLLFSLPTQRIIREVPALWRMELPPGVEPRDLVVSYELVASSGRRDGLSYPGEPDSEIRIRLRPVGPIEIDTQTDGVVVEGGVVLELDLAAARFAGDHAGTLVVTVTPR